MKGVIRREAEVAKERKDTPAVRVALRAQALKTNVKWLRDQVESVVEAEADQTVQVRPLPVVDLHALRLFFKTT